MSKAFVFDIDGVLLRGGRVFPNATKALNLLKQRSIPWILLTNGGGLPETKRVQALCEQLDVPISPNQFLQSHTPFSSFAALHDRVLVIGGSGGVCRSIAKSYGFKDVIIPADVVETLAHVLPYESFTGDLPHGNIIEDLEKPFDGVFVFHDTRDASADAQIVIDLLLSDGGVLGTRRSKHSAKPAVPIYFSNGDLEWSTEYNIQRLGQGAFKGMLASLYNELTGYSLEHTTIGKPSRLTYEHAERMLKSLTPGVENPEVYMVGDNQQSDIKGANDFGWESVLVRTGVYKDGDKLYTQPTHICEDVLSGVLKVLES